MPTATTIADDWDIDYTNRILSHKDMTLTWDGRLAGNAPNIGDWVRGPTSGAVGKVIGGTNLGGTSATGTLILTNVKGRFEDNEQLRILDALPFDTVDSAKNGIAVGDSIDGPVAEDWDIYAIEFNYGKQGVTDGTGTLYGIEVAGTWGDGEAIDNTTSGETAVALVNGSPTVEGGTWDGDVNEVTNGTGTPFSISGIINYDAGTEDIPNDALVLAGERATGVLDIGANPLNTEQVVIGGTTYTFNSSLGGANSVLIGATPIDSLRNLVNAVNGGAGIGTAYGLGTTPNTDADIAITDVGAVQATARAFIPSITTVTSTTTVTGATWTAATLNTGASGTTGRGRVHSRTLDSVTATGSYIINDLDGTWTDNNNVFIDQILQYDTVEAGQAFAVGDVIQGQTSGAQGRVIAVTSSRLILAEQTLRFEEDEAIHRVNIDQTTTDIADVTTAVTHADEISAVTINHPNSQPCPRLDQKHLLQGGLFPHSINPVRHVRQLYNYLQDTFDEFDQMDDTVPMSGQVKNAQYTLINNWFIPDRSMRFLDSGSIRDDTSDNIWANPQSLGTMEAVTNLGYGANAVQPQLYIEQNGTYIDPKDVPSLEGHINLLIKIKSNTDTANTTATAGEGVSIDNGRIRVYNRFYLHTYSHFFTATNDSGGVVTIALATSNDLNNITETHDFVYDNGAGTYFVGEEIVSNGAGTIADPIAVGVVVSADTGATGNVQYVLKSAQQFADPDTVTGQASRVTKDVNVTVTNVVAGYNDKIGFGHVDSNFTGGTVSGTFQIGEGVTQTGTSATGVILEVDGNTLYIDEDEGTGDPAWNGTGQITGDLSSATYTPTTRTADTVAPKDIGDEVDNDYSCIFALDKTISGSGRTIQEFYEYTKFLTAKESLILQGGRNQDADVEGRLYRKVDQVTEATPAFAEQVDAPYGIKAGDLFIGAQSVFVQDMASADIQNISLTDDAGTGESPPNLQTLEVTGLADGDKAVTYRTTTGTTIATGEFAVTAVAGGRNASADSIIQVDTGLGVGSRSAPALPDDVPTTGTIRVEDPNNAGLFLNFVYSSRSKAAGEFTLATNAEQPNGQIGDVTSATNLVENDDAYVTLLSTTASGVFPITASKQIQFIGAFNIMTRVRKRGILPFEVTGSFGTGGASIATIRTTDPVVDPV